MTDEELAAIEERDADLGNPPGGLRENYTPAAEDRRVLAVALREERAARLKAEAERDALQKQADEVPHLIRRERDEALALLSKAREAWARFAASDRLYHAYPCYHRVPVGGQTLPGAACTCGLADLAKILRTGETT